MRKNDQVDSPPMLALMGRFAEFAEFVEAAAAWDIDFRQVGPGLLNARLAQTVSDTWSLAKARFDRPAYQQGAAVPEMRTFAFLDSSAPDTEWCGRLFSPDTVAIFARDGDFRCVSPPGFFVYTISFTEQELATACDRLGMPDITETLQAHDETRQVDRAGTDKLCRLVTETISDYCVPGMTVLPADRGQQIARERVCEQLVDVLSCATSKPHSPSQHKRTIAVNRALEVIEDGLHDDISVRDVAKAANLSRRTLEYAFKDRLGVAPKSFINMQRLIKVRGDLRQRPDGASITDIANHWGFWHMGQFASDYRRQFGELPSETARQRFL